MAAPKWTYLNNANYLDDIIKNGITLMNFKILLLTLDYNSLGKRILSFTFSNPNLIYPKLMYLYLFLYLIFYWINLNF